MAIVLRMVQQFQPGKRQEFLTLEKQFANLEHRGILPRGERLIPIAAKEPNNTVIWQAKFDSLAAAEKALKLFETNPEHTELGIKQVPFFKNAWVEFYEVLEY